MMSSLHRSVWLLLAVALVALPAAGYGQPLGGRAGPWDETGSFRRADSVADTELIAALGGNRTEQIHALDVLAKRVVLDGVTDFIRLRLVQRTDPSVAVALASSGLMTDPDRQVRLAALRAAAAIPEARHLLAPQVADALRSQLAPLTLSPAEQSLRQRAEQITGRQDLFENAGARPGYSDTYVLNAAALAAASLGQEASASFFEAIGPRLETQPWLLGSSDAAVLAIGRSGRGSVFIERLLSEDGPPLRDTVIRETLLSMPSFPEDVQALVENMCGPNFAMPRSPLNPLVCDALAWRIGDAMSLARVNARIRSVQRLDMYTARALLTEFGGEGISALRDLARENAAWSPAAVTELCRLGSSDAGIEVVALAHELAQRGEITNVVLSWCETEERQMPARFAVGFATEEAAGLKATN